MADRLAVDVQTSATSLRLDLGAVQTSLTMRLGVGLAQGVTVPGLPVGTAGRNRLLWQGAAWQAVQDPDIVALYQAIEDIRTGRLGYRWWLAVDYANQDFMESNFTNIAYGISSEFRELPNAIEFRH